jgi:DNA-binding beta-propeller fold protein YncE
VKTRMTTLIVALVATLGPAAAAHAAGELVQKPGTTGCISEDTAKAECADGRGLYGATGVAVSPDGRNAYVAANESGGVAILDRSATGVLTQRAGKAACITWDGSGDTCEKGLVVRNANDVAVSPDGKNVYVASWPGGIAVFDRDATGGLKQKDGKAGCITEDGSNDTCTDGTAIIDVGTVAVSPDGKNVYVTAYSSGSVAVFDRDASGALKQKDGKAACISAAGGACEEGRVLAGAERLAISHDGRSVYVTSVGAPETLAVNEPGIAILDRDATGALEQKPGIAGCITDSGSQGACSKGVGLDSVYDVTVTPDGRSVYVGSHRDAALRFDRAATGALTQQQGVAFGGPVNAFAVTPDGSNVYTSLAAGSVWHLDRTPTGTLTRRSCVSALGPAGGCGPARALNEAGRVALSPDAKHLYVTSYFTSAVLVFDRVPAAQPQPKPAPRADTTAPAVSRVGIGRRARISFTLSEAATVRVVVRRRGGRAKTLTLAGRAGTNRVRLGVRARGRYRVTVTATDAAGNRSLPAGVRFRVARGRSQQM